jgi:O-antigen/teichoic acid export membrane protein
VYNSITSASVAFFIGNFFYWIICRFIVKIFCLNSQIYFLKIAKDVKVRFIKELFPQCFKLGLVQIGTFLFQRSGVFIASSVLGLEVGAQYSLTLTLYLLIQSVSTIFVNTKLPYINNSFAKNNKIDVRNYYKTGMISSVAVFILASAIAIIFGTKLLAILNIKTSLINWNLQIFLGLILLLELIHSIATIFISCANDVNFFKPALYTGIATLLISFLLVKPLGVFGLLIAQFAVQISYNNWKWPLYLRKYLA